MTWIDRALTGIAIVAALCGVYQWQYPTYSYRFRITIEFVTPQGVKSGSSVLRVTTIQYPRWVTLGANTSQTWVTGEATFIDLGNGRNLIALLAFGQPGKHGSIHDIPVQIFLSKTSIGRGYQAAWTAELASLNGRRELPDELIPTLVTFDDVANPSTLQVVKPSDISSVFGPEYRFQAAHIELTRSPVTRTLERKIPWVRNYDAARIASSALRRFTTGSVYPFPVELYWR